MAIYEEKWGKSYFYLFFVASDVQRGNSCLRMSLPVHVQEAREMINVTIMSYV